MTALASASYPPALLLSVTIVIMIVVLRLRRASARLDVAIRQGLERLALPPQLAPLLCTDVAISEMCRQVARATVASLIDFERSKLRVLEAPTPRVASSEVVEAPAAVARRKSKRSKRSTKKPKRVEEREVVEEVEEEVAIGELPIE